MSVRDRLRFLSPDLFPHHADVPARYSDVDTLRHINNVAIAQILSEGRYRFFVELFNGHDRPPGLRFVVGQVAIAYVREAHYPDPVLLGCGVAGVGRSSVRLRQAFFSNGRCTGAADAIMVTVRDGGAMTVPDDMRNALEELRLPADVVPPLLAEA